VPVTIHLLSKTKSLPLVIVLHGGGGNARNAAYMTGFSRKSDEEGFIVVYPNGTGKLKRDILLTWNAGNCCGYALENNIDDTGFIDALIERLERQLPINERQIFVTGISNGGMMSYRIGCELSGKIAAIAPVAGALNLEECKPTHPVSVIIFHGTEDKHVLYKGGKPLRQADRNERIDRSVSYAVSFWVGHNKCSVNPKVDENGSIIKEAHGNCENGSDVVLYTIKGEGHTWPGGKKGGYPGADESIGEISATDIMWDFFKNHSKR